MKAGVAPSTVSFVLNNVKNQSISQATRQRVIDCANELGYVANFLASNMARNRSRTIGVVLSYKLEHTYSHDIIYGLSEETIRHGYGLLICGIDRNVSQESYFVRSFLEGRIDGIIFISSAHSENSSRENDYIDIFQRNHIPFVVLYGYTNREDVSYINIDIKQGSYDATKFLIKQGLSKLIYIGVLDKNNDKPFLPKTERDRIEGYENAVKSPCVHFLPRDFLNLSDDEIKKMLDNIGDIDGFVTCWATIGIQLSAYIKTVEKYKQSRIITLDYLPYMEYTNRDVFSMKLPFYEISLLGVQTLIHKLENKNIKNEIIYCPCHL